MALRTLNIGTRMGAGFGIVLLLCGGMMAAAVMAGARQRDAMLQQLEATGVRAEHANAMEVSLLRGAVAVRNMGLQTTTEGMQRDEADAKRFRGDYLQARRKLEADDLGEAEKSSLQRLLAIDTQMGADFKEAVDLAASFNVEQAGAIITGKIDPLSKQANAQIATIKEVQHQRQIAATVEATAAARRSAWVTLGAGLALLLGATVLAWRLTLSITRPLRDAERAATQVARGELDFQIDHQGQDEATRLLSAIGAMRDSLAGVVANVRAHSESVATASSEIAQGNSDLSNRTEQQATALQETAASMAQLETTVRLNADNALEADRLAADATQVAVRGGEVARQVAQTMKDINDSSRRIADIVGTIDSIAFQTNILALNAAVEAARAGEQGRGFAVVATEVRALAQRSATAAREIKTLIADSVERVSHGTSLVDRSGETMTEIVQSIERVTRIVGNISQGSAEQSQGLNLICRAVTQMDQGTQQNAALVEESAAAAESLTVQARQLVQAVAVFRLAPRRG